MAEDEIIVHSDRQLVRISVPLALPLRGSKRMIVAGSSPPARPDPVLIAALRKAHAMVEREKGMPVVRKSFRCPHERRLLRLAFLAPGIQRDILVGHQPPSLHLEKLRHTVIPLSWKVQREALGWPARD